MTIELTSELRAELIKTNASDEDVARAAWVSNYGEDAREKDAERIQGLINFLYRNKHMSPFEHGSFTFWIDCPIFVAREFMRHRTFSYNEVSGRYKELEPRFYVPAERRPLVQEGKVGAYTFVEGDQMQRYVMELATVQAYKVAWKNYQEMLKEGIAREVARNVLPVGIYTQFYATANPRNIMQFLTLRNDEHALYEIRMIAQQIEAVFKETMPKTYIAYKKGKDEIQD
jgi:thymidylate synthase (FAD)